MLKFAAAHPMKRFRGLLFVACAATLAAQTVNYTYDQAGRLIAVAYPNGSAASYTYDANGNLLRKVVAPAATGAVPAPFNMGVVNAASEQGTTVAPGELVAVYGNNIGPANL